MRPLALVSVLALVLPATVAAQQPVDAAAPLALVTPAGSATLPPPAPVAAASPAPTPAADLPAGAPAREATAVGLRPAMSATATVGQVTAAPARRRRYGRSIALMATGGAAVVIGALAGGDAGGLLIFGGAIIGLVGLYDYLR